VEMYTTLMDRRQEFVSITETSVPKCLLCKPSPAYVAETAE
jgi:hypothetical protein